MSPMSALEGPEIPTPRLGPPRNSPEIPPTTASSLLLYLPIPSLAAGGCGDFVAAAAVAVAVVTVVAG